MRRLAVIALIVLLAVNAWARSADRLIFHGNRRFSSAELTSLLAVRRDSVIAVDSVRARLSALTDSMIARDLLFARAESLTVQTNRRGGKDVEVFVHEGDPARAAEVRWLGDSLRVPASVSSRAMATPGSVFRWANVGFDIALLLDYFENVGYPFARVELRQVESDSASGTCTVWLLLQAGPLTRTEFVSFPGVKQTREKFLLRESRLRLGAPYSQRRVDAARRRLARLDFMRRVAPGEITVGETGLTGVRFPVEEGRSTRLDVVAGYLPATENREALLSGLVNVELLNLFGVGRKARVHWERPDRRVQAADVSYREPWILGQPLALRVDFGQRIEDTLYVQRRFGARLEVDLSTTLTAWGAAQYESVFADSSTAVLIGLPESRTSSVETGFSFDTRDHPTNPRGGVFFSTQAGTGWRQRDAVGEMPSGSYRHQRVGMDAEVAQEVLPLWIVHAGAHARALDSDEPEVLLPDLYRLGGARTLRGYREEQFLGSRIGWTSLEVRYWLGQASRVFLFGDAGSVYRKQIEGDVPRESTIFRMAGGLGLRMESGLGVWGFDYGVGEEDRLLNGKLHVSLLSTF